MIAVKSITKDSFIFQIYALIGFDFSTMNSSFDQVLAMFIPSFLWLLINPRRALNKQKDKRTLLKTIIY